MNARFDGGMSGGPVFTDNGRLCGIICLSLPAGSETEEHRSCVAALWTLMGPGLDVNPSPCKVLEKTYPLIDLARQKIVHVDDLTRVSLQERDSPELYKVTFENHPDPPHGFRWWRETEGGDSCWGALAPSACG